MEFSLDSKYTTEDGTILLSGVQALVRLPMDQHRADRKAGLRTATLISGYRSSPLGGLDLELQRNSRFLKEHEIRFLPGVNEDLGATAVFGSQLTGLFPRAKYDGVIGLWYGKAPGVDRCGDVFKHANFAGVARTGGVLAIAGDDATAKSSTLPSQSEAAFYDALMPVVCPGNVQEVLDLGRLGSSFLATAGFGSVSRWPPPSPTASVRRRWVRIEFRSSILISRSAANPGEPHRAFSWPHP